MISSYATTSSSVVANSLQQFVSTTSQDATYKAVIDQIFLLIPLALVFVLMLMFLRRD